MAKRNKIQLPELEAKIYPSKHKNYIYILNIKTPQYWCCFMKLFGGIKSLHIAKSILVSITEGSETLNNGNNSNEALSEIYFSRSCRKVKGNEVKV